VGFQPPNADWRTSVTNLTVGGQPANALNVYLTDLRENRKLRSNERIRSVENGAVSEGPVPARLDCHYLISAWSPAAMSPAVEPTLDEHALLYQVAAVLFRHAPFNPSRVYPAGSAALNTWPETFRNVELPAMVLPVEGFNKLAEFWSGMGQGAVWKPAIYLVVTLPVALLTEIAGPMVTTRITEYRMSGRPETAEVWIQIGGHVLDATNPLPTGAPSPVASVWVELQNSDGERLQLTQANEAGRFTFGDLRPGSYLLRAQALGLAPITRAVDVPSPSGEYDLRFI
jgi:hypothetical protein